MISKQSLSLLEQLSTAVNIDADTLNVQFVSSLPIQVHDVTSNQRFVQEALEAPINQDLVKRTVSEMKGQPWEEVYAVCLARFGKNMLPHISGRLLAQTSAHHAFDEEYVYQNAKRYAQAWNAEGINNDRFCVKIATTSAGVRAAKRLKAEGIATLGTTLFSLPQAIAAKQAGMHAISMYFNEPLAHADASIWPDVADPAVEHPMAHRHCEIRRCYDDLKNQSQMVPQMKTASFVSVYEVMAMPELGADNITIGLPLLTDLASYDALPSHQKGRWKKSLADIPGINDPHFVWDNWTAKRSDAAARRARILAQADPLSKVMTDDSRLAAPDVDYLEGSVLDDINEMDEVTRLRLHEGLRRFGLMENASQKLIQRLQASLE